MKKTIVTCDTCNRDISQTGNCEDWRLHLRNEPIPSRGDSVTAMSILPILDADCYFCSLNCLIKFADRLKEKSNLAVPD